MHWVSGDSASTRPGKTNDQKQSTSLTAGKGLVVIDRPIPLKKAWAAADFIEAARNDVIHLCTALEEKLSNGNTGQ